MITGSHTMSITQGIHCVIGQREPSICHTIPSKLLFWAAQQPNELSTNCHQQWCRLSKVIDLLQPELESAFYKWLCNQLTNVVQTNVILLHHKKKTLQIEVNNSLLAELQLSFKFYKRRLNGFRNDTELFFVAYTAKHQHYQHCYRSRSFYYLCQTGEFQPEGCIKCWSVWTLYSQPPGWSLASSSV